MTDDPVELARRYAELWNARDLDGLAALWDADGSLYGWADFPEPGPWHGRDAVMGQLRNLLENFGESELTIETIEARGDWTVTRGRWRVRGDQSGVAGEWENSTAGRLRDGRIAEMHLCRDHADARRIAGLE